MNVFKKIESDPVINKSTQISAHDPEKFRFLSNLYWPFTEYGQLLEDSSPQSDYPVWPSLYYNTSSLLYQNPESTKYFLDFYQGYSLPVSYSAFPSLPEGDFTDSIFAEDINNPSATYIPYFIPSQTRLFSSAWAHYAGSGGFDSSFGYTYTYPTKAIYNQIKMLFNETQSIKFKIQDEEVDHFFAVVFDQKNLTGSIVPNTVVLPLMKVSDLGGTGDETSQITYTFTDKSQSTLYSDKFGYYSYLVSGNLSEVSSSEVFGTILYDYKTIILNTEKLETSVFYDDNNGTSIYTGSVVGTFTPYTNFYTTASQATNSYMLGRLLRNSQLANNGPIIDENNPLTATDFKFDLKNEIVESVYFLYVANNEFNYTNNPTCFSNEIYDINSNLYGKQFRYDGFKANPAAYITTIGLYNDYGEMVAVAKLNYPLKKDFSKSYLFKIRIKY
jgi:hypothetical protein